MTALSTGVLGMTFLSSPYPKASVLCNFQIRLLAYLLTCVTAGIA